MTETRTDNDVARPDLARLGRVAGEAVTTSAQRATRTARQHRAELLILAGTLAFALLIGVLSVVALTA